MRIDALYWLIIAFIFEYRQQDHSAIMKQRELEKMMRARLILAILSTLLEEAALVVIVLVGLPELDIEVPLGVLITVIVVWGVFSILLYQMGSRALRRKPIIGLSVMIGSRGKAVNPLALEGFVRIKGELWEAKSDGGRINTGKQVMVVGQDGLKLIVRQSNKDDLAVTK